MRLNDCLIANRRLSKRLSALSALKMHLMRRPAFGKTPICALSAFLMHLMHIGVLTNAYMRLNYHLIAYRRFEKRLYAIKLIL